MEICYNRMLELINLRSRIEFSKRSKIIQSKLIKLLNYIWNIGESSISFLSNFIMYKNRGKSTMLPNELEDFLKLLLDREFTEDILKSFLELYGPEITSNAEIEFDHLFEIMKKTILVTKSYYEVC